MSATTDKLLARRAGPVAHLVLNQPEKRNAICMEMWQGLGEILADFAGDPEIRAVVVSGAGGKAFSAGADISEFKAHRSDATLAPSLRSGHARARSRLSPACRSRRSP